MTVKPAKKQQPGRPAPASGISVLSWTRLTSARSLVLFGTLGLVLVTGMGVVHTTFKHRYAMHELQQLRGETNALEVQWGQLLIEQSTFGLEGRIENKAIEELGMKVPDWSGVIMVTYE